MPWLRSQLLELRRGRPLAVALVAAFVVMGAVGFLPLFGGPGYEHALATGLLLPGLTAASTALDLTRPGRILPSALGACLEGARNGALLAVTSLITAVLHLVHVRSCDPFAQVPLFFLTAFFGCVLAGVYGAALAELVVRGRKRRRLLAIGLSVAAVLACVAVSVGRFVTSPMIFAFDPFVGYFSGTLYDTIVNPGTALYTYRLGTLTTLGAALAFASALERKSDGRLDLRSLRDAKLRVAIGVAFAIGSLAITVEGSALDHWHTKDTIAEALGGHREGPRCTVVYPKATRVDEADLLLRDCEGQLAHVERTMGTRGPERVTAFFFASPDEKKRFMGAAHTYIAKPWRHEVYLQVAGFPHPVLGHELAHVVAGSVGQGPFRVAGEWGGLLPNPGLIEGMASAISPDDEDLTDAQWARAMKDLDLLPPMGRIFSLGFLGESSAKSYTVAGAFVQWVMDRFGLPTLHAWYGGKSLDGLTSLSWAELDAAFKAHLDTVEFPPAAKAFAEAKFKRPGVFGRACPHLVDRLRGEADACREAADVPCARAGYDAVLAKDPDDFNARISRGVLELKVGDRGQGASVLAALASDARIPRPYQNRADEALADGDLQSPEPARHKSAADRYRKLSTEAVDEDQGRTYDVKLFAAEHPEARPAIVALLVGSDPRRGPDLFQGGVRLGEWSQAPLARYLIGKNLAQHGFYDDARPFLATPDAGLPPRVRRELVRQRAITACVRRDKNELLEMRARYTGQPGEGDAYLGTAGGRKAALVRLIDRCLLSE